MPVKVKSSRVECNMLPVKSSHSTRKVESLDSKVEYRHKVIHKSKVLGDESFGQINQPTGPKWSKTIFSVFSKKGIKMFQIFPRM